MSLRPQSLTLCEFCSSHACDLSLTSFSLWRKKIISLETTRAESVIVFLYCITFPPPNTSFLTPLGIMANPSRKKTGAVHCRRYKETFLFFACRKWKRREAFKLYIFLYFFFSAFLQHHNRGGRRRERGCGGTTGQFDHLVIKGFENAWKSQLAPFPTPYSLLS